jgi:hypothetical protein
MAWVKEVVLFQLFVVQGLFEMFVGKGGEKG